jgi:DNA invertase Pin-like site-specific DNA recombinase
MEQIDEEKEEATQKVLDLLEEWGSDSKFIWFREIHRITDIDKGLLRNVINELKKTKEVTEFRSDTKKILQKMQRP